MFGGRSLVAVTRWSDLDSERWPCWRQNLSLVPKAEQTA